MKIGIDKISFNASNKYISIEELAIKRNVEIEKYTKGIGQIEMSIIDRTQDIVVLGALASKDILDKEDKEKIDLIIFATESSIDQSKAASIYIKNILNINNYCKCIEIKQACFSATAALDFARGHILQNENSKVLIIASDIAKYGVNTSGEVTQGAGAVAMLITKNPKILEFNNDAVSYTEDVMDFWRPNYSEVAFVDGKLSVSKYLELLSKVYEKFDRKNLSAICLHVPYSKMAYKGLISITNDEKILSEFENSITYNKKVGNIYTGSLYLSLISLLANSNSLKEGDNIGMYSYGSGAVAEFFSLKLVKGYEKMIDKEFFDNKLKNRKKLTVEEYENIFFEKTDNNLQEINEKIYLKGIKEDKRIYEIKRDFNVEI